MLMNRLIAGKPALQIIYIHFFNKGSNDQKAYKKPGNMKWEFGRIT